MLFINPSTYHGYRAPSFGMLCVAAWLRERGLKAEYLDCNFTPDWQKALPEKSRDCEYVGVTANALTITDAMAVSAHVRANFPGHKIVMGGPFPSVEYERLVPRHADIVVIGEGEETARELAEGRPPEEIAGLAYSNGGVTVNPPRPLIPDLAALPVPAWELAETRRMTLGHARNNPVLSLMTSRGCPFNCIYCSSAIVHRGRVRYRPVDAVLNEIEVLTSRHGAREIHFWDDNFTLNRERAMEICGRIAAEAPKGLTLSIPAGLKPDVGDVELFTAMRRAGFYWIYVAFETAGQENMNRLGKKVDVSKCRDTVLAARRAGLYVTGYFMLGLPFDTRESMENTINYACGLPINQALFFITIPFPGTKLHETVKREGRFLFHVDGDFWETGFFLGKACYEMPGFDAKLLETMYRRAYRRFNLRPSQMLRVLRGRLRRPKDLWYIMKKALLVVFKGRQF